MLMFTFPDDAEQDTQEYILSVYEEYKAMMYSAARGIVNGSDAVDDIMQDSMVSLIQKCDTLRRLSSCTLAAYVVYTVRNTAKNYLRKRQNTAKHQSASVDDCREEILHSDKLSPEELLLLAERRDEFIEVWKTLPETEKELLECKYVLGLSDKELAVRFGCRPDSIRMKLTRARRRAVEYFSKETLSNDKT